MRTRTKNPTFRPGMSWIGIVSIILVIVGVFIGAAMGARQWKRGADRSTNILNIRNVQQAVRGHTCMRNVGIGDAVAASEIMSPDGSTGLMRTPHPPAGLPEYTYLDVHPEIGVLYVTNNFDHPIYGFSSPKDYQDW